MKKRYNDETLENDITRGMISLGSIGCTGNTRKDSFTTGGTANGFQIDITNIWLPGLSLGDQRVGVLPSSIHKA